MFKNSDLEFPLLLAGKALKARNTHEASSVFDHSPTKKVL
jgi:hypothetical protein